MSNTANQQKSNGIEKGEEQTIVYATRKLVNQNAGISKHLSVRILYISDFNLQKRDRLVG